MNISNKTAYYTYLWCGGKYYAVLLEIFILYIYSAVKEFGKSVKIW